MDVAKALAQASTADLFIRLVKNSLRRSEMTQRVIKADLPDSVKVALIKSSDSTQGLEDAIRMLDNLNVEQSDGLLNRIIEAINWNVIGQAAEDATNRKKATPPEEPAKSWVYFIESKETGLIKIGKSISPDKRFNAIRTMSPDELVLLGAMPEDVVTEHELHKKFSHLRKHGEWFEGAGELHNFIDELDLNVAATKS